MFYYYVVKDSAHTYKHKFFRKSSLLNWIEHDVCGVAYELGAKKAIIDIAIVNLITDKVIKFVRHVEEL